MKRSKRRCVDDPVPTWYDILIEQLDGHGVIRSGHVFLTIKYTATELTGGVKDDVKADGQANDNVRSNVLK